VGEALLGRIGEVFAACRRVGRWIGPRPDL